MSHFYIIVCWFKEGHCSIFSDEFKVEMDKYWASRYRNDYAKNCVKIQAVEMTENEFNSLNAADNPNLKPEYIYKYEFIPRYIQAKQEKRELRFVFDEN